MRMEIRTDGAHSVARSLVRLLEKGFPWLSLLKTIIKGSYALSGW